MFLGASLLGTGEWLESSPVIPPAFHFPGTDPSLPAQTSGASFKLPGGEVSTATSALPGPVGEEILEAGFGVGLLLGEPLQQPLHITAVVTGAVAADRNNGGHLAGLYHRLKFPPTSLMYLEDDTVLGEDAAGVDLVEPVKDVSDHVTNIAAKVFEERLVQNDMDVTVVVAPVWREEGPEEEAPGAGVLTSSPGQAGSSALPHGHRDWGEAGLAPGEGPETQHPPPANRLLDVTQLSLANRSHASGVS